MWPTRTARRSMRSAVHSAVDSVLRNAVDSVLHCTPRLTVRVLEKRFDNAPVLGPIAFDVHAGEIVAVLGASGCGKSTLLRAIAGLDRDWAGEINVAGKEARPQIGMVFQEPRLLPWLTVEQNIAFADPATTNNSIRNSSIDGLLQEVCLENARHCLPKQLSGGMAQRVAIARALVREPDVLLLDEPFSALDVITRRKLLALTREVTTRHQTATVIVTHDPDEAVRLADRVLVLGGQGHGQRHAPHPVGATVISDFRPATNGDAAYVQVEGIIAALSNTAPLYEAQRKHANVDRHPH